MSSSTPFTFPGIYTIKIVGKANEPFQTEALDILNQFCDLDEQALSRRYSKNKRYLSFSAEVYIENEDTLKQLTQALYNNPNVIMVL